MPVDLRFDWDMRMSRGCRAAFVRGWNDVARTWRMKATRRTAPNDTTIGDEWEQYHYEAGRACAVGWGLDNPSAKPPMIDDPAPAAPTDDMLAGFMAAIAHGCFTKGWMERT